ncbi:MAG: rhomboid family intramembrane serine protease [Chitinophagales bacterium]|nr:rhomboid family intramembrane serine protease [Chitinophagales bacterium]
MAYGRRSWFDELKEQVNTEKMLTRIILVNVGVFVAVNLFMFICLLITGDKARAFDLTYIYLLQWLELPGSVVRLLQRPWVLATNLFTHFDFFHLLFNMLNLFWFGSILHEYIGPKKLLPLFFYAGIVGGLLFILSANILPFMSPYESGMGASASVMGIIVAAATLLPEHEIRLLLIGDVKLKFLAAILVLLDLLLIHDSNTGGHIAHLGGALFGFIYIRQMRVGHDWSIPFNRMLDFFRGIQRRFGKRRQPRVVYKRESTIGRKSSTMTRNKQEQIDAILDKINRSGYDSLSKEEKAFLFQAGKED